MAFFRGNVRLLPEDLRIVKPTLFAGVPRVLARVYEKVQLIQYIDYIDCLHSLPEFGLYPRETGGVFSRRCTQTG